MDGVANTPEKMERYIKTVYNKANEMDRLINELTFYSKMDTNKIRIPLSKISVTDFFDDHAEDLKMELSSGMWNFLIPTMWARWSLQMQSRLNGLSITL